MLSLLIVTEQLVISDVSVFIVLIVLTKNIADGYASNIQGGNQHVAWRQTLDGCWRNNILNYFRQSIFLSASSLSYLLELILA